jgi:hypothetical protein
VTRARRLDGAAWLALCALLAGGAIVVTRMAILRGGPVAESSWLAGLAGDPAGGLAQPWRWWTAAWVHWSLAHLAVNLVGTGVVAAVGWRARAPGAAALAWLIAWPLTQVLLSVPEAARFAPSLQHDGGLSGVLHAGTVVIGLTLAWPRRPARGAATAAPAGTAGTDFPASREPAAEPSRLTEGPWAMTSLEELSAARASRWGGTSDAGLAPGPAARDRWIGALIVAGTVAKVLLEAPWNLAARPSAVLGIAVLPPMHASGLLAGAIAWGAVRAAARRSPAPSAGR